MAPVDRKKKQMKPKSLFFLALGFGLLIYLLSTTLKEKTKNQESEKSEVASVPFDSIPIVASKNPTDIQTEGNKNNEPRPPEPCYSIALDQNYFQCDRACFLEKLKNKSPYSAQFVLDGWFDESQPVSKNQKSLMGQFYLALAEMGMLSGNFKVDVDDKKGISRLEKLMYQNPNNAVYPLFAMAHALSLADYDRAKKYKEFASQNSTYYDSFFLQWSRELLQLSLLDDGFGYSAALGLRSSAPVPNFSIVLNLAKQEGGHWFSNWIEFLVKPGLESDGKLMDVKWLPIEYAVGYQLNVLNSNLMQVPHMGDLKSWTRDHELSEMFTEKNKETCSPEQSQFVFKSHLSYLEKWLSNEN